MSLAGLLSPAAVVARPDRMPHPIEQRRGPVVAGHTMSNAKTMPGLDVRRRLDCDSRSMNRRGRVWQVVRTQPAGRTQKTTTRSLTNLAQSANKATFLVLDVGSGKSNSHVPVRTGTFTTGTIGAEGAGDGAAADTGPPLSVMLFSVAFTSKNDAVTASAEPGRLRWRRTPIRSSSSSPSHPRRRSPASRRC